MVGSRAASALPRARAAASSSFAANSSVPGWFSTAPATIVRNSSWPACSRRRRSTGSALKSIAIGWPVAAGRLRPEGGRWGGCPRRRGAAGAPLWASAEALTARQAKAAANRDWMQHDSPRSRAARCSARSRLWPDLTRISLRFSERRQSLALRSSARPRREPPGQNEITAERGQGRAEQDAELGLLDQRRLPGKGERADEQAHREADPAEHGDAVNLQPARALRPRGEAEARRRAGRRRKWQAACRGTGRARCRAAAGRQVGERRAR